jgi:adenine-specific DNA-methyltransferase
MYFGQIPIPSSSPRKRLIIDGAVRAVVAGLVESRMEQLLSGFVYELFFASDLHARGLTIFDEAESAGLDKLSGLEAAALVKAAESFAATHLVPGSRLRTMLSDLQTLDVVRIIEGNE